MLHESVSAALGDLIAHRSLHADPDQERAASVLDRIAGDLAERRLFRRGGVRGAYLHGDVGRGKTMLMDLFFSVATTRKERSHFHEFMDEVHSRLAALRASGEDDLIAAVAQPITKRTRLLCLDEFQVSDIANAMLLGRLFEKLFAGGITLVATSNTPPDDLYANGLNRQLFLPFVAMLKANCELVPIGQGADYRREKFAGQQVYRFGDGPEVAGGMEALWLRLTGGVDGQPEEILSLGRTLSVRRAAMGAARFQFDDLCDAPLGARDYLRIAHQFDTLMIENVPQFDRTRSDASKRFILLIDTLYDRGIKLAASFSVPLDDLARDPETRAEFARTASRLIEMQSEAYLEAPHKAETTG
jgi:cell division protein ZapE